MSFPIDVTRSYRATTLLASPAVFAYTLLQSLSAGDYRYLAQRLGFGITALSQPLWLHCASVGEVKTALPLISQLLQRYPQQELLVTTNTVSGAAIALNTASARVHHAYLPLDYPFFVHSFLNRTTPHCCLLFETELWPQLIYGCAKRNVPVIIINGRISNKTLHAPALVKTNYRRALQQVSLICARSAEDGARFIALGAAPERMQILDDLKYAPAEDNVVLTARPLPHPYILCASTHEDEELQIIRQWQLQGIATHKLVMAPRHPRRIPRLCRWLRQQQIPYTLHSERRSDAVADVYFVDTLGELEPFMAHAEVVFVGGSLVKTGGHNVLEPARHGRGIFIGPHHFNFAHIVTDLRTMNGIRVTQTAATLVADIKHLLQQPDQLRILGGNAKTLCEQKAEIVSRYLEVLRPYLTAAESR